jgi:hypothetical protein
LCRLPECDSLEEVDESLGHSWVDNCDQ